MASFRSRLEGKVAGTFGPTIKEWDYNSSAGREKRLGFLCALLNIPFPPPGDIPAISSFIGQHLPSSRRSSISRSMQLCWGHSFSESDQWLEDYERFVSPFGASGVPNQPVRIDNQGDIPLFLGWVRGEKKYLGC